MNSNNTELVFAIIDNNVVVNMIVADTLETAQSIFSSNEVLQVISNELVMGSFKENGKWYPPKPSETSVWVEELNIWLSEEDHQEWSNQ
jgi:hypothetical protein